MSHVKLWKDLDYEDEEDKDNEEESLYEEEDLDIELEEDNDYDLFETRCANCHAIIDNDYQCDVCGWLVGG